MPYCVFPPTQMQVCYKGCADMIVRTKAPQGVLFKGELYIGGGYVTESKMASIIQRYEPVFQLWDQLPSCPLKLFGMASFDEHLVIIGGKEAGTSSNKIYSLSEDRQNWNTYIPPMTFARVSPVVIGYDQFLIVAGGDKGSLDYNMEVYDTVSKRWNSAPPLPTKCFRHTSTVSGHNWFLLSQDDGSIKCADIRSLVRMATGVAVTTTESPPPDIDESAVSVWSTLPNPPTTPSLIATIGGHLLGITQDASLVNVHAFLYDSSTKSWLDNSKSKLPNLCGSSSAVSDDKDSLFLFGGEGGTEQFSNKLYRVSLRNTNKSHFNSVSKPSLTFHLQ